MADTMQFDLVSPERRLASVPATEVRVPGMDGDMTVMPGHAAVIATLRPGILRVLGPEGETEFAVTGGFVEVTGTACTVLAERAHAARDVTQAVYDDMMSEFRARHAAAKDANLPGPTDEIVKLIGDLVAVGTHIGLDPKQPSL